MRASTRYAREAELERHVCDFVPYIGHVARHAIATYDGELIATWRVTGIPFETAEADELVARMDQLHGVLRSIASPHVAIWQHTVRRRVTETIDGSIPDDWCDALDQRYRSSLEDVGQLRTEHFVTVVYRPEPTKIGRIFSRVGRRREALEAERVEALAELEDLRDRFEVALVPYMPKALGTYIDDAAGLCSSFYSFLSFLMTGRWQAIKVTQAPLDRTLASAWVFAGTETLEIRTPTETRYARCLDLTDYPEETFPGMIDKLLYSAGEIVLTQSFSFIGKLKAREQLRRHRTQLENAGDDSVTELLGIDHALDELTQGKFAMGGYHFSLMLYGESIEEVRGQVAESTAAIEEQGFVAMLASTALDAAYYAQLPANFIYRPRVEFITSRNFAALGPLHGFASGRAAGNPWGPALTMFQTTSGQPFYYSFHLEGDKADEFGDRPLANARVIGMSTTGKTVLLCFLAAQALRFAVEERMTIVFFDKDRGARLFVASVDGKYHEIKTGEPTGFNPFRLDPTPENRSFLERLVGVLASRGGAPITVDDERRISDAIAVVLRLPPKLRRLSTLLQNISESRHNRESSLVRRLARWCADDGTGKAGALGWVIDSEEDTVDFETHRVYGFDGSAFLDGDPEVRTVISMYLLHRLEQSLDGRRFIYFMDEAGKWIDDTPFTDFAGTKQTDIRKRNGMGVFATQMPSQFLDSPIARALVEQVATEIYLPNPRADHREYVTEFGLTEAEYQTVRHLPEQSRTFLLKQRFAGHGRHSVVARLDLSGFDDELAVLSGTTENNALADRAIDEAGDIPANWLPIYHRLRRERDADANLTRGDRHANATSSAGHLPYINGTDGRRADPND